MCAMRRTSRNFRCHGRGKIHAPLGVLCQFPADVGAPRNFCLWHPPVGASQLVGIRATRSAGLAAPFILDPLRCGRWRKRGAAPRIASNVSAGEKKPTLAFPPSSTFDDLISC